MATPKSSIVVLFVILFHLFVLTCHSESDAEILLRFKESLENTEALSNWDNATPLCNWRGILCDKGHVWGIQLEHAGLGGVIDVETLTKLTYLRSISLMHNNFEGSLPNFTRLGSLKTIYLSNNKFTGEFSPRTFVRMLSLKKLYLDNNAFSGSIPATLVALPRLMELMLQNNEFIGNIPPFQPDKLKKFNVSNNKLVGEIPASVSHFDASSFSGNEDLCGAPMQACAAKGRLSVTTIVIVAVLVGAALIALIAVVIILFRCKRNSRGAEGAAATTAAGTQGRDLDRMERGHGAGAAAAGSSDNTKQGVKISFLKEDIEKFDMADLLKASAEVLGSGAFGSTYKAGLPSGNVMVVKRYRQMNNVGKEEFNEHMRRLGRLSHENVLSVVAFYYRKEEKLLVAHYVENGSLAFQLHGNRSGGHTSLDWARRLNIVKGAAKGLQYLYNELPSLTAPHGHLKSSNVLLDKSFKPVLADYGLIPVVNQEDAQEQMISYKSPEYKVNRRITKKTDVWSLGILILEILTGRFPSYLLQQGSANDENSEADLATWVETAIYDCGSAVQVFDKDMLGTNHSQGEMMKLLKIGLLCCQTDVERRPDIKEALDKIEEVKEKDVDDDFYSSYASETDMRSSRGLSDDFRGLNL